MTVTTTVVAHPGVARRRTTRRVRPDATAPMLRSAPVIEGDCPACHGTYEVASVATPVGTVLQVPEHERADHWTWHRRCPCSGWLARNTRPRKYFYTEGVRFL